ncbi:MAG: RsmD family RNA methyltransferase [Thermoplasmata archaeon]|nr:RsmD family RNA methyltransferase [Thermoplasmata archaeon]
MTRYWFELSGENGPLARAELDAVVETLGGSSPPGGDHPAGVESVEFDDRAMAETAAAQLASARRVLELWPAATAEELEERFRLAAREPSSAAFRLFGGGSGAPVPGVIRSLARAYVMGGGSIDLERPARRFWLAEAGPGWVVGEELPQVDRRSFTARNMPKLPFQRPVSLPPRLARIAVNLGHVRRGARVVDPFVGTGALLAEAALVGARVTGVDRDASMIRGATRNFAYLRLAAEAWIVDDASTAAQSIPPRSFDVLVTDPPYGRASSSGGETPPALIARVLQAWAPAVRPDGRIVLVTAGGPEPLPAPWQLELAVKDRVHRSLTREFRVYRRRD